MDLAGCAAFPVLLAGDFACAGFQKWSGIAG
jgi:hypothetical protein